MITSVFFSFFPATPALLKVQGETNCVCSGEQGGSLLALASFTFIWLQVKKILKDLEFTPPVEIVLCHISTV